MKERKVSSLVILVLCLLLPADLLAHGYSAYENQKIWELRLAAGRHAARKAEKICGWAPKSPITYSDQLPSKQSVTNETLFSNIMFMLRRDQNARAISDALPGENEITRIKVREVDSENLIELKRIFTRSGFPTIEEVGETGVNAMLMLVAHADQGFEFQKQVVLQMDDDVAGGKLPAVYPMILKAIRPQIIGNTEHSVAEQPSLDQRNYLSPKECYSHSYQNFINVYLRHRYKNPK